jgi:hypothetical protein
MLARGASVDKVLGYLRKEGCEVIDSIRVLTQIGGMDLATAKRVVHISDTWSDRRSAHERFHEQVEEVAREEAADEEGAGK